MGGGSNIFDQSSQAMANGANTMNAAVTPGIVGQTMNQYLNPYQSQVIDDTMGRMQDQQAMDLNQVRAQAAQSSAYGGARQGLVESNLMDNYNRNAYEAVGGMNQQGFNTAAQLGQNRIGQLMQGGQMLGNMGAQGMGIGQQALGQQAQAGNQQQQLMQGILSQASGQYDQYANYPMSSLSTALAGVQGNPLGGAGTTTATSTPGLFDYLSLGAGMGSSYLGGK